MDNTFSQKSPDQVPVGQEQEAVDAVPSEQSGTNVQIGTPVWKSFVQNQAFQDANREGVQAEREQMRQADEQNRRAASHVEKPEIWKGANGKLLRKSGGQNQLLNPVDFVDHPVAGPEARKSLWDKSIRDDKKEASDAAFMLRDPEFHAQGLAEKDRKDIEAEGSVLAETDPRHIELKQKLIADDAYKAKKAELGQLSWDREARARQTESTDPETWWQNKKTEGINANRQSIVADAQAQHAEADVARASADQEHAGITAQLAQGVKGSDLPELQARKAEIEQGRAVIDQSKAEANAKLDAVKQAAQPPPENNGIFSNILRGGQVALEQTVPLAQGVIGGAGQALEKTTGYGKAIKDWGFHGYESGMAKTAPLQHENDSLSNVWEKVKKGDLGSIVDLVSYGVGYMGGQMAEMAIVSGMGGVAGGIAGAAVPGAGETGVSEAGGAIVGAASGVVAKGAVKAAATAWVEKSIAKQAMKIAVESAEKSGIEATAAQLAKQAASEEIRKIAAKSIGAKIATMGYGLGMEVGTTMPEAYQQAQKEGREQSGFDVARAAAFGIGAGALEGVTDIFKLDLIKGKYASKIAEALPESMSGITGRVAAGVVGAGADAAVEGGTEAVQTVMERLGGRQSITDDEAKRDIIDSAGLGAVGGIAVGGVGGAWHHENDSAPRPAPQEIKPDVDTALAAINPTLAPAEVPEIQSAALLGGPGHGPKELAQGVLIERNMADVEAQHDQAIADADAAVSSAPDTKTRKVAEANRDSLRVKPTDTVRAAVKIAAGQDPHDLTVGELTSLGMVRDDSGGGAVFPMTPKERQEAGITEPMSDLGPDGSVILTDAAIKRVRAISPLAGDRIAMPEATALKKAQERAAKLSTDTPDGAGRDVQTGSPTSVGAVPSETKGAVEFDVPMRDGTSLRVQASDASTALEEAAAQAPITGQPATPVPNVTNPQVTQSNPASGPPAVDGMPGAENLTPDRRKPAGNGTTQAQSETAVAKAIVGAKAKIANATKNTKLAAALNITSDPAHRAKANPDGKITINPDRIITEAMASGMSGKQAGEYFSRVLDEEIRHVAQYAAAEMLHKLSGSKLDLATWRDSHYSGIWAADFAGERGNIVRDLYTGKDSDMLVRWDAMSDADKALEGIRMMSQGGRSTEAAKLWAGKRFSKELIATLKAVLKSLKDFVGNLDSHPTLQTEITNLENALRALTGTPEQGSTTSRNSQSKSNRENQDAGNSESTKKKRPEPTPVGSGTDTPRRDTLGASSFNVGQRVEFVRDGEQLTGQITYEGAKAVRVQLADGKLVNGMDKVMVQKDALSVLDSDTKSKEKPAIQESTESISDISSTEIDKFVNAYSAYHLIRIAKEARNGKQSNEYYEQRKSDWTPERVRGQVSDFLKVIDNKDVSTLVRYNNGMFEGFWKIFGIRTGMAPMPKTQIGIADVIRSYVGDEAYNTNEKAISELKIKKAKERSEKDEEYRIESLRFRAEQKKIRHEGKVINGRELADQLLAEGWRVINTSDGKIPRYQFVKGDRAVKNSKGFGEIYAYARDSQKDIPDPVDPADAIENANFNALSKEDQESINGLFAPSATEPSQSKKQTDPELTSDEQALKDFFGSIGEGLESAPLASSDFYKSKGIPRDKRAAFLDVADKLYDAGVRDPANLAAKLEKIGNGKLRQYSAALWSGMQSSYPDLANFEDWAGVYAGIDQKTGDGQQVRTDEGARDAGVVDSGESVEASPKDFQKEKGQVIQNVSNDVRDFLLGDEEVTMARVKSLHPANSTLSRKELDEAIEAGITAAARKAVQDGKNPDTIYSRLIDIYHNQPSLNSKTSTSKINQAYSTPAPLAYVASRLADIAGGTVIEEPTGGHGMLLLETTPTQTVLFNEIDANRRERTLLAMPEAEKWQMTGEDGTTWTPKEVPDRIAANPPFGSVMGENGENIIFQTNAGPTTAIDHAIMLKALEGMAANGRAVFIIGGPAKTNRTEVSRKDHYAKGAKAAFFKHLHDNYGVVDHFTVDGDMYAKQGAGWNVDIITVQGKGPSKTALPSAKAPRMLSTWADLFKTTQLTDEDRIQLNRISETEVRDTVRGMVDALAGIRNLGGSEASSVRNEPSGGKDGTAGESSNSVSDKPTKTDTSGNAERGSMDGTRNGSVELDAAAVERGSKPVRESARTSQPSERSGDPARAVRKPVKESGKFQAEYTPFSGEKGLDTLLPKNMVGPVATAFERIKRDLGGNLTKFVHEKLGYPADTDITKYLAGEQIDAVAAAIWNFERGGALIIGDQTGIGKGRIAAALIKYAVNQGFIPVFMTKDPGLHDAMLTEDLPDIASPEIIPAVMDTKLQFDSAKKRKLNYGEEYFDQASSASSLPGDSNAIFVTYSQITADDAKGLSKKDRAAARAAGEAPADKWRMRALRNLAPNAVFILDESHLASGQSTTGWRVADILHRSSRVYYSSATSVKRPENMGIYFKTNVGQLTGGNMAELTELMNSGGVPAMQVVSSMLAQDGQYLRRERSFDGVKFITQISEETETRDRELADGLTGSLRHIVNVQDAMRQAADAINTVITQAGKRMNVPAANRAKLETVNFSSKLHNIVGQYLLAIKTQSAADTAIREIRAGKKVVVAVQSTMESAIDGLESGGFEMSYKGLVLRYLDQMRFLTSGEKSFGKGGIETFEVTEKGLPEFEDLTSKELEARMVSTGINPETGDKTVGINDKVAAELMRRSMWDVFERSRDAIESIELGDLPISPIDAMRQAVERAGIRTGEITGRKRGIDTNGEIYARSAVDTSKPARRVAQAAFNNEDLDFLVINQSGSTGISLHASEKAKVQSTRVMIVAQPNLDINEFMQTLGRIHRSGQVVNPEFILLQTALPAEKRPAAILGKKMSMLNANTTSNAKTDVSEGNTAIDIFNQYGDEIAYKVLERDKDLQDQLRPLGSSLAKFFDEKTDALIPYQDAQKVVAEQPDGYIARTITGYLVILPVEEQEIFWEKTLADYNAYISYLDQIGQNALEAKALDLQAKTTSSEVFTEKAEGDSAFSAPSYIETVETKVGKAPLTGEKAVEMSVAGKAGAKQILQSYLASADAAANDLADKKAKRAIKPWDAEKRSEFLSNQRSQRNIIASAISLVGRFGNVKRNDGNAGIGVIEEIKLDETNPLTPSKQIVVIRVNDSRETLRVPVTQINEAFTPAPNESAKEWNDSTDVGGESAIATGNLMAAMKALGGAGKVITYTTDSGDDKMGILLPKSFLTKRAAIKARTQIKTAEQMIEILSEGLQVTNSDGAIKWTKSGTHVSLSVPASRAKGGDIWRNPVMNRISIGSEFIQVGNEMRAKYATENVPQVFQFLTEAGETFSSPKASDDELLSDGGGLGGLHSSALPKPGPFESRIPFNRVIADDARGQQQEFGKNVSTGNLASFGSDATRKEMDAVTAVYEYTRTVKKNANEMNVARQMLKENPTDIERKLLMAATDHTFSETPADHLAIQLLIDQKVQEAGNDVAKHGEIGPMIMAYRMMRGEAGRLLQIGYDRFLTPAERFQASITDAIYTPTRKIQKSIASVPLAQREAFIRKASEDRLKKVQAMLAESNLTVADITRKNRKMALQNSRLDKEIKKTRSLLDQDVLKDIQNGASMEDLMRRWKGVLTPEQAQEIKDKAYAEFEAKLTPLAATDMTDDEIIAMFTGNELKAGAINADGSAMTPEQVKARVQRLIAQHLGMTPGALPKKSLSKSIKPKAAKAEMTAEEIRAAETSSMEKVAKRWMEKLAISQSDTLSWGTKAQANINAMEALIREHVKTGVKEFRQKAEDLGATSQQSFVIDKEANEERRRVAAINIANTIAANTPEAIAKKWIGKFSNSTTYSRLHDPKGKPVNALATLIKSHLKAPVIDFIKQATALGVTSEQSKILEAETTNERAILEHVKAIKAGRVTPTTADWSRPELLTGLESYSFDTKDRAGIMTRVETLRILAGAVGKVSTLTGEKLVKANAAIKEIDQILSKYGSDLNTVLNSDRHVESYGFDINDINHVASVARMISTMDADWLDKAIEFLYANLLSGLQTMMSNAGAILPAAWESTVGRGMEMAINTFVNDPMQAQLGEVKHMLKALGPAITRAKYNALASFQAQHPMADRDLLNQQPDLERIMGGQGYRANGSISGKTGDIIRIPTRLLMATDDFNTTLLGMVETAAFAYRLAKAEGKNPKSKNFGMKPGDEKFDRFMRVQVNTPGSEASMLAFIKAKRAIYNNPLPGQKDYVTGDTVPVNDIGDKIGELVGSLNSAFSKEQDSMFIKGMQAVMKITFFPFQRVPFNILRKGIRYVPNPVSIFDIGLGAFQNSKTIGPDGKGSWQWNAGKRNPELIERLGQQLQGAILMTALMALGAGEGDDDDQDKPVLITGSSPFTPKGRSEREAQIRSGIGPYRISFRRKDGSERLGFNYGRIEPVATILAATIDLMKSVKRAHRSGKDNYDAASEALGGLVAQTQDKSFLRGFSDLMALLNNLVAEPDLQENRKFQQFLAGKVAMLVPNIIKQPIREADGLYRERSNSFMQEVLYQAVPYGQKDAKTDPYGREAVKTGTAATRIIDVTDGGSDKVHPIDAMLLKFRDKHPGESWFPAPITHAEFKSRKTGQNIKMDDAQLAEFRTMAGKRADAILKREVVNFANPSKMDVEKVKKAISQARSDMKNALAPKFSR